MSQTVPGPVYPINYLEFGVILDASAPSRPAELSTRCECTLQSSLPTRCECTLQSSQLDASAPSRVPNSIYPPAPALVLNSADPTPLWSCKRTCSEYRGVLRIHATFYTGHAASARDLTPTPAPASILKTPTPTPVLILDSMRVHPPEYPTRLALPLQLSLLRARLQFSFIMSTCSEYPCDPHLASNSPSTCYHTCLRSICFSSAAPAPTPILKTPASTPVLILDSIRAHTAGSKISHSRSSPAPTPRSQRLSSISPSSC